MPVTIGLMTLLTTGGAFAGASVSWLAPANGTSYTPGTVVNLSGIGSGVGGSAGSGLDLALVLDSSGSMWGAGQPAQQAAALALVAGLPSASTSVTIIDFDSYATLVLPLTPVNTGLSSINSAISGIDASGGTNIGAGISVATAELTGANHTAGRTQIMVVVSDGYSSGDPPAAADAAILAGVDNVHSVGIPGHDPTAMQDIVNGPNNITGDSDDTGIYTAGSLDALTALFNGTSGNLVGLTRVDITLPDGTVLTNVSTDGLGNFSLSGWSILPGANTFTVTAFATDGGQASTSLTLYGANGGTPNGVPDGGTTAALLGVALCSMSFFKKKIR